MLIKGNAKKTIVRDKLKHPLLLDDHPTVV
jgi:hypothetical protein